MPRACSSTASPPAESERLNTSKGEWLSFLQSFPYSETKMKKKGRRSKRAIRRFPRLLEGTEAAALEKLLWNKPEFQARVQPDKYTIDFVFSLRYSQPLQRYRSLRHIIFGPAFKSWEGSFRSAYSHLRYGDKALDQSMANNLHRLFNQGVRLWLQAAWSLKGIRKTSNEKPSRRTELATFDKEAPIKSNQPDPRIAIWTANKQRQWLTAVRGIRQRLKSRAQCMQPAELRREIERMVPYKKFSAGLEKIAPEKHPTPQAFFTATWLSAKSMVDAMLAAELERKGFDPKRISVKTYLKEGKKLLTALSALPQPHRW